MAWQGEELHHGVESREGDLHHGVGGQGEELHPDHHGVGGQEEELHPDHHGVGGYGLAGGGAPPRCRESGG